MDDFRLAVAQAIRDVASNVRWKPGKETGHLEKRKAMGHLSPDTTLTEYNGLIRSIVREPHGSVFVYRPAQQPFVAVRADVAGRAWLAIFSLDGIMETAFPPRNIDSYLARPGFTRVGTVEELLG